MRRYKHTRVASKMLVELVFAGRSVTAAALPDIADIIVFVAFSGCEVTTEVLPSLLSLVRAAGPAIERPRVMGQLLGGV